MLRNACSSDIILILFVQYLELLLTESTNNLNTPHSPGIPSICCTFSVSYAAPSPSHYADEPRCKQQPWGYSSPGSCYLSLLCKSPLRSLFTLLRSTKEQKTRKICKNFKAKFIISLSRPVPRNGLQGIIILIALFKIESQSGYLLSTFNKFLLVSSNNNINIMNTSLLSAS